MQPNQCFLLLLASLLRPISSHAKRKMCVDKNQVVLLAAIHHAAVAATGRPPVMDAQIVATSVQTHVPLIVVTNALQTVLSRVEKGVRLDVIRLAVPAVRVNAAMVVHQTVPLTVVMGAVHNVQKGVAMHALPGVHPLAEAVVTMNVPQNVVMAVQTDVPQNALLIVRNIAHQIVQTDVARDVIQVVMILVLVNVLAIAMPFV